jgi:hypothetical protein
MIDGQPSICGVVGVGNAAANQARTAGENASSTRWSAIASGYVRGVTRRSAAELGAREVCRFDPTCLQRTCTHRKSMHIGVASRVGLASPNTPIELNDP